MTPGIPSELLAQRPDIGEAEALLAAADANVEAARAAFFPTIPLTGEGGFQSAALKTLFQPDAVFYTIAAGADAADLRQFPPARPVRAAEGPAARAAANLPQDRDSGFRRRRHALVAVRQSAERERLQRDVVESSRRAFDIAETRLREGTVDLVTVLTTQQTLFQAQDALLQVRLARLQAVVGLYQALGGGWLLQREGRRHAP